ncbi:MAG: recombinase family protein [Verrucomicrobiia bacterium]
MIRQILGVVSEWEKSCIVQKLRAARVRSKEKNGRCEGRKPYGAKDGEAEIVTKIQGLRAERLTITEIADQLNVEGVKTRSGGQWHYTQVRRILARGRPMKTTHQITVHGQQVTITVKRVATRFGILFVPTNNYGEPATAVKGFKTEREALEHETESLKRMLAP